MDWLAPDEPVHTLAPVVALNQEQMSSGGRAHLSSRVTCTVENLAFIGGNPVASPRSGEAAFRQELAETRRRIREAEGDGMQHLREQSSFFMLPDQLKSLRWADLPVSNLTRLQQRHVALPDLLVPSVVWGNVGHAGQVLFWAAQCGPEGGRCGRTLLLQDGWLAHAKSAWAREAARGLHAPLLERSAWLPAAAGIVGNFLLDVPNIGHATTLPEEWFADTAASSAFRRRMLWACMQLAPTRKLGCRCSTRICITVLVRPPPRKLVHEQSIIAALRAHRRDATVSREAFHNRPFAEQLAVAASTTVLVAPHGAGMVNAAFMPDCSVVIEAYPCGLMIPFYGHLAWNSGKMYLPVHPAACWGASVGNAQHQHGHGPWNNSGAVTCTDRTACRYKVRNTPVLLRADESVALLDEALAMHAACRGNSRDNDEPGKSEADAGDGIRGGKGTARIVARVGGLPLHTRRSATLVMQGYSIKRVADMCAQLQQAQAMQMFAALLVVWNNERRLWPGCPGLRMVEGSWSKASPRIIFAAVDRIDNAFLLPGNFTPSAFPTEAVMIMQDDVSAQPSSLRCLYDVWAADKRLVVGVGGSQRAFDARQALLRRCGDASGSVYNAASRRASAFCFFLPQLFVLHHRVLHYYARSARLHDTVLRTEICDDVAISAVATILNSPRRMTHVAVNLGAGIGVNLGHNAHNDSLSTRQTHYAKRARCPREILRAMSAEQARPLAQTPFMPSSLILQCDASSAGALRFSTSPSTRAHADAAAALAQARAEAGSKMAAISDGASCCGQPPLASATAVRHRGGNEAARKARKSAKKDGHKAAQEQALDATGVQGEEGSSSNTEKGGGMADRQHTRRQQQRESPSTNTGRPCRASDLLGVGSAGGGAWRVDPDRTYWYQPRNCTLTRFSSQQALQCLRGRTVVFVGDSLSRYSYLSLASLLATGAWPPDRELESLCFEASFFTGTPGETEFQRWKRYFLGVAKHLGGHEVCDCFRNESCASCSSTFCENRFLEVAGAKVYFVTQIATPRWSPRGHVRPGPFEEMRRQLQCEPGSCSEPFKWQALPIDFMRRELRALGATDVVINTGHHWSPSRAPAGYMDRLFAAAAATTPRAYWRTTTSELEHLKPHGTPRQKQLRHPPTDRAATRNRLGVIDALSVTAELGALPPAQMERAFHTRPDDGKHDNLHFVCSIYRQLNEILLGVLCDKEATDH